MSYGIQGPLFLHVLVKCFIPEMLDLEFSSLNYFEFVQKLSELEVDLLETFASCPVLLFVNPSFLRET